jgi:hypothetical protein
MMLPIWKSINGAMLQGLAAKVAGVPVTRTSPNGSGRESDAVL